MEEISLKEYFEKILDEKEKHQETLDRGRDKALLAALAALNERLGLLNELRSGVATKDEIRALDKTLGELKTRLDKTEGSGAGIQKFIGWVIAAIAVVGFIIAIRYGNK